MPTLIVVTGLVILFGKAGVLAPMLEMLSGGHWQLYGLSGILLAHVYLNMPFVVRVLYLAYQSIPESSWKLARQLKLSPTRRANGWKWGVQQGVLAVSGWCLCCVSTALPLFWHWEAAPNRRPWKSLCIKLLKYDFNMTEALLYAWVQLLIAAEPLPWSPDGDAWLVRQQRAGRQFALSWRPRPGPFQKGIAAGGIRGRQPVLCWRLLWQYWSRRPRFPLASLDWPLILRSLGLTLGLHLPQRCWRWDCPGAFSCQPGGRRGLQKTQNSFALSSGQATG